MPVFALAASLSDSSCARAWADANSCPMHHRETTQPRLLTLTGVTQYSSLSCRRRKLYTRWPAGMACATACCTHTHTLLLCATLWATLYVALGARFCAVGCFATWCVLCVFLRPAIRMGMQLRALQIHALLRAAPRVAFVICVRQRALLAFRCSLECNSVCSLADATAPILCLLPRMAMLDPSVPLIPSWSMRLCIRWYRARRGLWVRKALQPLLRGAVRPV